MATQAPDDFRQQVLDAYGIDHEEDLDFDGYVTARAAANAEYEAFRAAIPGRLEKAAREATELLRGFGVDLQFAFADGGVL